MSARAALLPLALLMAACGEPTAPPQPVAALTIQPGVRRSRGAQDRTAHGGAVDASGSAISGWAMTWASSDLAVATVSPAGRVTTLVAGSTTITVTCEGRSATAVVVVFLPIGA